MKTLQPMLAPAPNLNPELSTDDTYVVRRLDQLETHGKYSVIYEITRIETLLTLSLVESFFCGSTNHAV
jgi:hypothetical protein